jgi:hypothetical protein
MGGKSPPQGATGSDCGPVRGSGDDAPTTSACAIALEGFEEEITDGSDVGLDAIETVGISPAILGPLGLDAFAIGDQFTVKPLKQRFVGKSAPRDGGKERYESAEESRYGGRQTMITEGRGGGGQEAGGCRIAHAGAPIERV